MFIICELLQRVSNGFEDVEDMIEQFKWHSFSNKLKRMLPIILINVQQTVVVECFGNIACNREAFKMVCLKEKTVNSFKVIMYFRLFIYNVF